jgi:hypothetical protein
MTRKKKKKLNKLLKTRIPPPPAQFLQEKTTLLLPATLLSGGDGEGTGAAKKRIEKTRGQGKDYPPSFFRHLTVQRTQDYRPGVGAAVKESSYCAIYEQKTQLSLFRCPRDFHYRPLDSCSPSAGRIHCRRRVLKPFLLFLSSSALEASASLSSRVRARRFASECSSSHMWSFAAIVVMIRKRTLLFFAILSAFSSPFFSFFLSSGVLFRSQMF